MNAYLITAPSIYTNDIKQFELILQRVISDNKINFICFRDKESSNYKELAKLFVAISNKNNISNIFINTHIELAISLKVKGVHLTSNQFDRISYAKNMNLEVIISCHTESDIKKALLYKADYITYSPIFDTPNKGDAKGIEDLKYIVNKYKSIKIFALGGIISYEHIELIKEVNCYGFSSIRYFINK